MSEQLEATRERSEPDFVPRPRNREVEAAWRIYAQDYEAWQRLANASSAMLAVNYANTEDARLTLIKQKYDAQLESLMWYFEEYDKDQREAFDDYA